MILVDLEIDYIEKIKNIQSKYLFFCFFVFKFSNVYLQWV